MKGGGSCRRIVWHRNDPILAREVTVSTNECSVKAGWRMRGETCQGQSRCVGTPEARKLDTIASRSTSVPGIHVWVPACYIRQHNVVINLSASAQEDESRCGINPYSHIKHPASTCQAHQAISH